MTVFMCTWQELHAHLNTSFDSQTLKELVEKKAKTNEEVLQWSMSISDSKEMDEWDTECYMIMLV